MCDQVAGEAGGDTLEASGDSCVKELEAMSISCEPLKSYPEADHDNEQDSRGGGSSDSESETDSTCTILNIKQQTNHEPYATSTLNIHNIHNIHNVHSNVDDQDEQELRDARAEDEENLSSGHLDDELILSISNLPANDGAANNNSIGASGKANQAEHQDEKVEQSRSGPEVRLDDEEIRPLVEIDLSDARSRSSSSSSPPHHHDLSTARKTFPELRSQIASTSAPNELTQPRMQFSQAYRRQEQLPIATTAHPIGHPYYSNHHDQPPHYPTTAAAGNHLHHQAANQPFRGFSEAQPKLSFASQRVKEYFETFKSHRGETRRLYQFFKSTRTELVACLLFTLITSQALIVLRSGNLGPSSTSASLGTGGGSDETPGRASGQLGPASGGRAISWGPAASGPNQFQGFGLGEGQARPAFVHLAHGLAMAFTVASLTQVFGHISGCHLIPSVSLALYVKGHISRVRLASYLAAQLLGSALGLSLLALLTSSQITPGEYTTLLHSPPSITKYQDLSAAAATAAGDQPMAARPISMNNGSGARRKREAATGMLRNHERANATAPALADVDHDLELAREEDVNLGALQGSETILLSIMEQQQHDKQQQQQQALEADRKTIRGGLPGTFPLPLQPPREARGSPEGAPKLLVSSTPPPTTTPTPPPTAAGAGGSGGLGSISEPSDELSPRPNDGSRARPPEAAAASSSRASVIDTPTTPKPQPQQQQQQQQQPPQQANLIDANLTPPPPPQESDDRQRVVKLRRKKRNRQQQQVEVNSGRDAMQANNGSRRANNDEAGRFYINLLEFALPDQIMASESIGQCIDKQQQFTAAQSAAARLPATRYRQQQQQQPEQEVLQQLAASSFRQCLSLSNSSQMFVFQFLATLLVVLTYLVNVDPRRIDLGFKSLSIGLAYFVASLLTVHSGGFFGNPFHLLFLNWLSTTSEWRSEWLIYLITPLIAGLFGALSHEYIDFSSLRNRNKQLHLRRSFYSLDNLPQNANVASSSSSSAASSASSSAATSQGIGSGGGQRSDSGRATVVEIASLNGCATRNRPRKVSSSSSLESAGAASSSMMSLNEEHQAAAAANLPAPSSLLAPIAAQLNHHHHHYSNIHPVASRPNATRHRLDAASASQHLEQQLGNASESFGTNRKLISYSRQLRLEQQRATRYQAAAEGKQSANYASCSGNSLRRSDFDSNFLISSSAAASQSQSPPTATKRQIHTSGWM